MDTQSPASAATPSAATSSAFTLLVKVLVSGQQRDSLHIVGLTPSNTIGQLKSHIQTLLQEHPPPSRQRLMHAGHELRDQNASLKEALKLQDNPVNAPVLHLVVREDFSTSSSTMPNPLPQSATTTSDVPSAPSDPNVPQRSPTQDQLAQQARAAIQTQLNMLQHQINLNHHNLEQQTGSRGPITLGASQTPQANAPTTMNFTGAQLAVPPHPNPPQLQPYQAPLMELARISQLRLQMARLEQQLHAQPAQLAQLANNMQRDGRAPSPSVQGPMNTQVHENVLPNGQRVRTVVSTATMNYQFPINANPTATQRPAVGMPPMPITTPANPQGNNNTPHFPYPFASAHLPSRVQPSNPTAWLLSSPRGPEALLFAPGHGYFSSRSSRFTTPNTAQPSSTTDIASPAPTRTTNAEAVNNTPDQPQRPPVEAHAQQLQPLAQAQQAPNQPANQEQNEIFNLIVNRGWLFLRLYLFTFVLSEPGTWRRTILLVISTIICLLPQDNPINAAVAAVRQHVDNLIGLPRRDNQPALPRGEQNGDGNQRQEPGEQRTGTAAQPSPEETARRLLRQQEQRNPNTAMDTLRSVERAVALFLASLIPGVGERYVRAREEERDAVRREQQRQEEERRNAEGNADHNETANGTSPVPNGQQDGKANEPSNIQTNGTSAVATGVEAGPSTGEARSRTVGTVPSADTT